MPKRKNSRAASGSGSIRQRPDGRWEARYSAGRDPGTGKQIQRSVYGDTQKEVLDKLTAIRAGIASGTFIEPSVLTAGQWLDVWVAEYLGGVKESTRHSYMTIVNQHIKPSLGAIRLQKLAPHMIQNFYNGLARKKGLSAKTIKNVHGALHAALKQAMAVGYVKSNPADACKLPRVERREMNILQGNEIGAFLDAIKGDKYEAIYYVTLFTGLRQGEALGLTWDCLDLERGVMVINKQLQKSRDSGQYQFAPLKNDKERKIALAPSVTQRFREHKSKQAELQLSAGSAWDNPLGLVFTNETGGHLAHFTVYKHYKQIVGRLGLGALRFHDLRHSYAVAALQSGDDPKTVQEALGHHTAAFTLDVYGHVSERMKEESAARMEGFIKGIKTCKG